MKSIPGKIRNDKLWEDVYALVEHAYGKIDDLIAEYPDEQWATASKLRNSANDSLFYASQAIATPNSCLECKGINGQKISVDEALNNSTLPVKDCSFEPYGCRCVYSPAI